MNNVKLIKYVEKSFNSKPAFLIEVDDLTYISNHELFIEYTGEGVQILIENYDCGNEIDELLNQPNSITDWSDVKDGSYAFKGCKERIDISDISWDSLVKATAMFNRCSIIGPEVLNFKELKTVRLLFNKCTITGVKHIIIPKATSIISSLENFNCIDLESIECDNVKFVSDSFNHNEEQYSKIVKISLFSLKTSIRSFYNIDYDCLEVLNIPNLERVYNSFSFVIVNELKYIKQSKVTKLVNSFNAINGAALEEISFNTLTKSVGNFLVKCRFNNAKVINLLELRNANKLLNMLVTSIEVTFNLPKLEIVNELLNYCHMSKAKLIELNELVSADVILNDGVAHELETISLDKLTKVKNLCNYQTLTSLTKLHLPSLRTAELLINYSSMNSILELDITSLETVTDVLNSNDLSKCNNISIDKLVTVDVFMNGSNFESLERLVVNHLHNTDVLLDESKFGKLKSFETKAMFRPITLEDLNENKGRCRKIVQVSESEHSIN